MLKTRRRKGLGDQIAVSKYLDDEFVVRVIWHILAVIPVLTLSTARFVFVWACRFVVKLRVCSLSVVLCWHDACCPRERTVA